MDIYNTKDCFKNKGARYINYKKEYRVQQKMVYKTY